MGLQSKNPFENEELDDVKIEAPEGLEPLRAEVEPTEAEIALIDLDPIDLTDIDHIAIAVADLAGELDRYRETFGATVLEREVLPHEGVEVAVLDMGASRLHLMMAIDESSWLVEFLDGQASGISHVGLRVADITEALEVLGRRGWELIDSEPQPGVAGTRTAYVHPADEPGTLMQLVEPA